LIRDYIADWERGHVPPLLERVERAA
jgi:hypothetical protein